MPLLQPWMITPYTPVGAGGDAGGSQSIHAWASRQQQQRQFEAEQQRLRDQAAENQRYQRGLLQNQQAQLSERQRQFDLSQKSVKDKEVSAAFDELNKALLSANQDQVDLAVQKLQRLGIDAQSAVAQVDQSAAPKAPESPKGPESPEAKQLERDVGLDETLAALDTSRGPATGNVLPEGATPVAPVAEAPKQEGAPAPKPPPGFDVDLSVPAELGARPGEQPFSGYQPAPQGPPPFNPFTGAAFAPPLQRPMPAPVSNFNPFTGSVRQQRPMGLPGAPLAARMQRGPQGIVIRDESGNVVAQYDPQAIRARAVEQASSTFESMVGESKTDEEKYAASIAKGVAANLIGQRGVDPLDAAKLAMQVYNKQLGRDTAEKVAGVKKPTGAFGGSMAADTGLENFDARIQSEARQIANNMSQRYKMPELQQAAHEGQQLLAKIRSKSGVSQNEAINSLVKMAQGSRPSDADRDFALRSGGAMNMWHTKVNSWINSGRLPEDFRQQIEAYANVLMAFNLEKQAAVMEKARANIMQNPFFGRLPPEVQQQYADWVAGHATGNFAPGKTVRGEGSTTAPPKKKSSKGEGDIMEGIE